jgi:uncharacterized protein (DUF58 family)
MIPSRRLLVVFFVWLLVAIAASVFAAYLPLWGIASAVVLGVVLADALTLMTYPKLRVERKVMQALALGRWTDIDLTFHNPGRATQRIEVFDHHPIDAEQQGQPHRIKVRGHGWTAFSYQLRPFSRGPKEFGQVQTRLFSLLGLWRKNRMLGEKSAVRVYPNFASVVKFTLLATDQRLGQMGILKKRRRGEGLEFHQLREYREGDVLRQIDWNATARLRKLISRDYTDERDQQIVFLVDCGRRMLTQDGDLSHFDHTLNAILLLSHVALRQGDAVGIMTFSGDNRWIAPRKSMATVSHILNNIYDLQPGLMAPDYVDAATRLMAQQRRRALVILITNLRDEDNSELLPALQLLRRRHLVLLASMKEPAIEQRLDQDIEDFGAALEYAATQHYLTYRRSTHQALDQTGIYHLDVVPDQLPINIVNRYLDIKSTGRL